MEGMRGDDAIDPGAPPTCGFGTPPPPPGAANVPAPPASAFGVGDLRAVRLRLFFDITPCRPKIVIMMPTITITIDYFLFFL